MLFLRYSGRSVSRSLELKLIERWAFLLGQTLETIHLIIKLLIKFYFIFLFHKNNGLKNEKVIIKYDYWGYKYR